MDRLSRTLKKTLYATQGRFPPCEQSLECPACLLPSLPCQTDCAELFQGSASPAAGLGDSVPSGKDLLLHLHVPGVCIQMFAT